MSDPFIGEIKIVPFNFAPEGWSFCEGQLLPIAQHTALFSLLGTTYGGDGETTFAVPDFRGRFPRGAGQGAGLTNVPLGQRAGAQNVTLGESQMPRHTHTVRGTDTEQNAGSPNNALLASGAPDGRGGFTTTVYATGAAANQDMANTSLTETGGTDSVNLLNPFTAVHFIIALIGVFPSEN